MEYSNQAQLQLFLFGILLGIIFGLLFDIFRVIRVFSGGKVSVFFQDFIYFLLCSIPTFIYLFVFNRGQVRFFALLSIFIGATAYYLSVGRFLFPVLRRFLFRIKNFILRIFRKKRKKKVDRKEGKREKVPRKKDEK